MFFCTFATKLLCAVEKNIKYDIDLKGLASDCECYSYHIDDAFFAGLECLDIKGGDVCVEAEIRKVKESFELTLKCRGSVTVVCDRCLDDMSIDVDTEDVVPVKFGAENEDSGDAVIVSEDEGILDLSWLIYEFISLSLPLQHVHEDGGCNKEMMACLAAHSPSGNVLADEEEADPRWNELKKILDNN